MADFEFDYDPEADSLFLYKKNGRSKGSVELGDLIFDFDYRLNLVAMQILNASGFIEEVTGEADVKELLKHLKRCEVKQRTHKNLLVITITLTAERKVQIPLTIPNIKYTSPSLAYA
ncbi:MAG: DUF2283 domain-containing protein [Methanobacteriota archaeon]|nr:MAG: DUF2283 domain-containing protein [Euryarchaeota archaeon]